MCLAGKIKQCPCLFHWFKCTLTAALRQERDCTTFPKWKPFSSIKIDSFSRNGRASECARVYCGSTSICAYKCVWQRHHLHIRFRHLSACHFCCCNFWRKIQSCEFMNWNKFNFPMLQQQHSTFRFDLQGVNKSTGMLKMKRGNTKIKLVPSLCTRRSCFVFADILKKTTTITHSMHLYEIRQTEKKFFNLRPVSHFTSSLPQRIQQSQPFNPLLHYNFLLQWCSYI